MCDEPEKKTRFILSGKLGDAAGEEELLAVYLRSMNDEGEHDFTFEGEFKQISLGEGMWQGFKDSLQRKAQIEEDKISYAWDELIERFNEHIIAGTLVHTDGSTTQDLEQAVRFLARASRFHRRVLSIALIEIIKIAKDENHDRATRVVKPDKPGEPCYIFLVLSDRIFQTNEEYRIYRREFLAAHCQVAKLLFPDVNDFVGIAFDHPNHPMCSEDLAYYDAHNWTKIQEKEALQLQKKRGILVNTKKSEVNHQEYPDIQMEQHIHTDQQNPLRNKVGRNAPCPCGSGKKYKRCCLP